MSDKPFTREDLAQADVQLLRDGRAANAVVTCVTWKGRRWTVKDFSSRSWWVRRLLAPFLLGRELKILRRLSGVDGVAEDAFRIDADAIARAAGNAKCANVVLVGALAARLDIPVEVWEETVAERVPQKTVEANLAALRAGRAVIENEEGE